MASELNALSELFNRHLVWQGGVNQQSQSALQPTGWPVLDKKLHGGWPQQGLVELTYEHVGSGELSLFLPVLSRYTCSDDDSEQHRLIVLINPPFKLNASALDSVGVSLSQVLVVSCESAQDALWSAEQSMMSGSCRAVFVWGNGFAARKIRRLQLAAKDGQCLGVLFTSHSKVDESHPVSVKLALSIANKRHKLQVLKRHGGWPSEAFEINLGMQQLHRTPLSVGANAEHSNTLDTSSVIQGPWSQPTALN